jgi:hypothetical protein
MDQSSLGYMVVLSLVMSAGDFGNSGTPLCLLLPSSKRTGAAAQ